MTVISSYLAKAASRSSSRMDQISRTRYDKSVDLDLFKLAQSKDCKLPRSSI